jgi:hypothetical protein
MALDMGLDFTVIRIRRALRLINAGKARLPPSDHLVLASSDAITSMATSRGPAAPAHSGRERHLSRETPRWPPVDMYIINSAGKVKKFPTTHAQQNGLSNVWIVVKTLNA